MIFDIRRPYRLRETLLARRGLTRGVAADWVCSAPATRVQNGRFHCASEPIDPNLTPNATGHDFGNWFPARLTLEKVLNPSTDSGLFDLRVGSEVVLPGAGDGDEITVSRPPGTYTVSEVAAPGTGTDLADYKSTVRGLGVSRMEAVASAPARSLRTWSSRPA